MAGIGADGHDAAGLQEIQRAEYRFFRGIAARRNRVVAAGQPTKIEDCCRQAGRNRSGHFGMAAALQRNAAGHAILLQQLTGGFHSIFLDIKGIDAAFRSHLFRQKEGIVSVSHRRVDNRVARLHSPKQYIPRQVAG